MTQHEAQLEGLAIGLEQRGEKSAAHLCRIILKELTSLRAELLEYRHYHDEWVVAANIRMVDQNAEIARLRAELDAQKRENFKLAAGLCREQYCDDHGNSRCKFEDEIRLLRMQLESLSGIMLDNQAEITRLRAERDALRAALRPFANAYWEHVSTDPDDTLTGSDDITAGDVRRARAAMEGK